LIKIMKYYAYPAPIQTLGHKEEISKFLRGQLTSASNGFQFEMNARLASTSRIIIHKNSSLVNGYSEVLNSVLLFFLFPERQVLLKELND